MDSQGTLGCQGNPDILGGLGLSQFNFPEPRQQLFFQISDLKIVPTKIDITAPQLVHLFFNHWYCDNGLPRKIVCDRDKLFVSDFWKCLMGLTGVKIKMSSSFHPETDGSSEQTNKTINQSIYFYVE